MNGFPVVTQASHTQFSAGDVLTFPSVQSRMVLGCHEGTGTVAVNGMEHPLTAGLLYLLPWGHSITYRAARMDPFFVYGMHIVPWHRAGVAIELTTAHFPRQYLHDVAWRAAAAPGAQLPPSSVIGSSERARPGLTALTQYAIEVFGAGRVSDDAARAMGTLALAELAAPVQRRTWDDPDLPSRLRRLLSWIDQRLDRSISLAELAETADCAPVTVSRMFRRHLGQSPSAWVADRRVERACERLASTHLGIAQVSRAGGFDDPYYFSRVFKAHTGMSPRDWRMHRQL